MANLLQKREYEEEGEGRGLLHLIEIQVHPISKMTFNMLMGGGEGVNLYRVECYFSISEEYDFFDLGLPFQSQIQNLSEKILDFLLAIFILAHYIFGIQILDAKFWHPFDMLHA